MQPLINVIVPVYNVEPYIRESLDSIINQTYKNLDIILVDDGSTDASGEICDEYARSDSRIRVFHQENGGVSAARNTGLEEVTGEYIAWIDPDDVCSLDMIEYLYLGLKKYDADMSQCRATRDACTYKLLLAEQNQQPKGTYLSSKDELYEALGKNDIWHNVSFKLYKSELYRNVRFPKLIIGEDSWLNLTLIPSFKSAVALSEIKYYYRQRDGSLINTRLISTDLHIYVELFQKMISIEDDIPDHFAGKFFFSIAHLIALKLATLKTPLDPIKPELSELFRLIRSTKDKMLDCPSIGRLGKLEIPAICTGHPWSWHFAVLCQKIYDFRAEKRGEKNVISK